MQNENCSLLGPLRGIHFIVLSAPPLASQVKSPYPSQYVATLLEKTTLACWFARQVQMLGWGKLAWFSGLPSRWNSKTGLQHLCNPEARVKLYIIWQQTSHYLRLPLQAELSGGSASESIDAEIRMLQAANKAVLMELLLAIFSQSLLASDHCMASIHHLVRSSTGFTSEIPLSFSIHGNTFRENNLGALVCKTGTNAWMG